VIASYCIPASSEVPSDDPVLPEALTWTLQFVANLLFPLCSHSVDESLGRTLKVDGSGQTLYSIQHSAYLNAACNSF
jgi:hypothetical protein